MKRPSRVRSSFGTPVEIDLEWQEDGQYSFFILDGYRYQMGPRGTCTTAPQNRPRYTVDWTDLRVALMQTGWNIIA